MAEMQSCPNCNAQLKSGVFSTNELVSEKKASAINLFTDNKSAGFCDKCYPTLVATARNNRISWINRLTSQLKNDLPSIPVITLQHPIGWDYTVIKMITAQYVTGEGALTEFTSAFSEMFGSQSNRLGSKLKTGEDACFSQLRLEAANIGANAVIATDIDFSEIGGQRSLLMICMSGTAVKLNNIEVLPGDMKTVFTRINETIRALNEYQKYADI